MSALPKRQQNRIERERRILMAARAVFAQSGYSGTTMDAVAIEAGLSKPTLYQYFESKETLFSAMMLGFRNQMMDVFERPSPRGMVSDLFEFSWDYADTVLDPDMLSLARLIVGEVQRFPEIGHAYQASGPDRLLRGIMDYLQVQRLAGRLDFDDAELAAQDLWGLILSAPRTQAIYMPDNLPSKDEIGRYVHNGLRVFLKAYSTRPSDDIAELTKLIASREPRKIGP